MKFCIELYVTAKNEDNLKNEGNLKTEDHLKTGDHLKNKYILYFEICVLGLSLHNLSSACRAYIRCPILTVNLVLEILSCSAEWQNMIGLLGYIP